MTLELSGLRTAYADFAFGPVDLSVGEEVLAVLGPSGSGKTTLLSLVAGITDPDAGSVTLEGRELVGRSPETRGVGLVFQEGALFPHMSARENVAYAAAEDGRVDELAELLELEGVMERRPPELSGGERQRVALARTLAADPDALLLDEPLSSLDAPTRRRLREELHGLLASLEIPVLYVTHDQRSATALGDRVAIVRDGTLEQVGEPATLLERPASRFVARFTGTENLLEGRILESTEGGTAVRVGDATLRTTRSVEDDRVTVCIHPSRVELAAGGTACSDGGVNELAGTVTRWLNEGAEYRVDVDLGGRTLTASVRPATFEGLALDTGSAVSLVVPPESVHLIPAQTGEEPGQ